MSRITSRLDRCVDAARGKAAETLGIEDPIRILPYWGYGTADSLLVRGRVLQDEGIKLKEENPSFWENVWNMYRRFATDEVHDARLRVSLGDVHKEVLTNSEGFFELEIQPESPLDGDILWQPLDVSLLSPATEGKSTLDQSEVLVVRDNASFGVISDIDDTIVHTAATDLLKMIRIVYLGSAESRRPFDGVADFYQALQNGKGAGYNPIFYVSSSAWNMYDVFARFMELNDIPKGPLFLKDVEFDIQQLLSFKHEVHKLEQIQPIFKRYPQLPFILIGDSGQKDVEIYADLVKRYPNRILGILIRDVVPYNTQRQHEIDAIADVIASTNTQFLMFQETQEAIDFAAKQGWILAQGSRA